MSEAVRDAPGTAPRLRADRMLGKLARILRMIGHDVEYERDGEVQTLVERAAAEGALFLTRNQRLEHPSVVRVESNYPFHQARELIHKLGLSISDGFYRCIDCNGCLNTVAAESVRGEVPAAVLAELEEVRRCDRCQHVFWAGRHVEGMRRIIRALSEAPLMPDEDEADEVPESGMLEPLLDLHQAIDVMFLEHRIALMRGRAAEALAHFRRFASFLEEHIALEERYVLPLYTRFPPENGFPRGGAPDIVSRDHQLIRNHLEQIEARLAQLPENTPAAALALLDRQKVFVDLLGHHDRRERLFMYAILEETLGKAQKSELLERLLGAQKEA